MQSRIAEAAVEAVQLAEQAAEHGTFGIGGMLLDANMLPLFRCVNKVIENGVVADPTAHVERQLIDWYYGQRKRGRDLPPPDRCTIVSTIDPCMQCTGAILASGFRCIALAPDRLAGLHCRGYGNVDPLPAGLRDAARRQLHLVHVKSHRPARTDWAEGLAIPSELVQRAADTFAKTVDRAKAIINEQLAPIAASPSMPLSAAGQSETMQIIGLHAYDRAAVTDVFYQIGRNHDVDDLAAFVDPTRSLLYTTQSDLSTSPIQTSFMRLTRLYAGLRRRRRQIGRDVPPHPRHCDLWTLQGPGQDALSVMTIGAFGSTIEGPVNASECRWLYLIPQQPAESLAKMIARFPPLYSEIINITPRFAGPNRYWPQ
jgi:tRNA(Arg) A34 adenosine deaminase TadA